ncbi:MAG TPA: acetylglutamate kinase [Cyclobacteriaceae bacterium]|nr:acetylglutamate kinase [Cyclobacteriaceae bacterium]
MNRLFIVKIGGEVLDQPENLKSFLQDFAAIKEAKILIHGGGKIASNIGNQLSIESKYVNGRRITDADTLDLVTMVYGGLVNKQIVAGLQVLKCNAIGLTGADGNILAAKKRAVKEIDFGFVGDIEAKDVNVPLLYFLLKQNAVPVFAPLTHADGTILNTNADTIAKVLAVAMSKHFDVRLIYCFDKAGVLKNIEDENSVIPVLDNAQYKAGLAEGIFANGMLPKLENAFEAIHQGVKEVLIGHAQHLLKNTKAKTIGTLITK